MGERTKLGHVLGTLNLILNFLCVHFAEMFSYGEIRLQQTTTENNSGEAYGKHTFGRPEISAIFENTKTLTADLFF